MQLSAKRLFTAVAISAAMFAVAGADGKKLTAEQQAAKAVFDENLKEPTADVISRCGVTVPVTIDFENFDKEAWIQAHADHDNVTRQSARYQEWREELLRREQAYAANCANALTAIQSLCKQAKLKPLIASQLKGVRCMFSGLQAQKTAERESTTAFAKRNITFAGGIFTVNNHPYLGDVEVITKDVLKAGVTGTSAPGAEVNRGNGETCNMFSQCASRVCDRGACRMCKASSDCQKGSTCDAGTCWAPADRATKSDAPASSKEPATGGCSPRNAVVVKDGVAECCSKKSKLVKAQRICM